MEEFCNFMLLLHFKNPPANMLLLLILCTLISQSSIGFVEPYNFSFASFGSGSCGDGGELICLGSVVAGNWSLNITPDQRQKESDPNQVGRVLFRRPVNAWPASFSSTFIVKIVKDANTSVSGDGMAFILAEDTRPSPPESYGSYIGILNPSTPGGVRHQLAVELDTYRNEGEIDGNHIAIDTISIADPVAVKSLNSTGIKLKSGREIAVRIEYDGWIKMLTIYVAYAGEPLVRFLDSKLIIEDVVPKNVYVGFTASTGYLRETHELLRWNFTSYDLPEESLTSSGRKRKVKIACAVAISSATLISLVVALVYYRRSHDRRNDRSSRSGVRREDLEMLTTGSGPRMFSFRKLSKATRKFSKDNLLGSGGFGSVYKGVLSDHPPSIIAVKKISATSTQGEREYLAEICTIGRLRHKNLVQLKGWCHDGKELLLVYEYMPNGSLDRFIGKISLDWEIRYKILTGLASVLVYLHEECGNPVVHRDVKPNNVMLDADYNPHLGDFGLARLLHRDATVTTMIAGTPGYLAPEVSYTGKATPESDVYSFGMVVLEVVCGRRSKGMMEENSLVDFVWASFEKGELIKCADQKLGGKLKEEEIGRTLRVGLACVHPDFMFRPRMRKVVQILLNPEEPLMQLPASRPSAITLPLHYFSSSSTSFSSKPAVSVTVTTEKTNTNNNASSSSSLLHDEMTVQYEGSPLTCRGDCFRLEDK